MYISLQESINKYIFSFILIGGIYTYSKYLRRKYLVDKIQKIISKEIDKFLNENKNNYSKKIFDEVNQFLKEFEKYPMEIVDVFKSKNYYNILKSKNYPEYFISFIKTILEEKAKNISKKKSYKKVYSNFYIDLKPYFINDKYIIDEEIFLKDINKLFENQLGKGRGVVFVNTKVYEIFSEIYKSNDKILKIIEPILKKIDSIIIEVFKKQIKNIQENNLNILEQN